MLTILFFFKYLFVKILTERTWIFLSNQNICPELIILLLELYMSFKGIFVFMFEAQVT